MRPIDPAGFEAKFRADIDPWGYRVSPFEAFKRGVLVRACGDRTFGRALELACAIGENSRALAPRCLRLLAVDSSRTAIHYARRYQERGPRLRFAQAELPRQMPRGPFDLIVISELLYYLTPHALHLLMRHVERVLAPGGRLVLLHHLKPFGDAAQLPILAQRRAMASTEFRKTTTVRMAAYEAVALAKPKVRAKSRLLNSNRN